MGKIDPHHIHAGTDHVIQDILIIRCRTERGDNLRSSLH
jgi:hypothetical protein